MYYATYAPYGTNTVYEGMNLPTVHVFESRADRDTWVEADEFDGNWHRETCTYRDAERYVRQYSTTSFPVCRFYGGDYGLDIVPRESWASLLDCYVAFVRDYDDCGSYHPHVAD